MLRKFFVGTCEKKLIVVGEEKIVIETRWDR